MDLGRKVELAEALIKSIAEHDDAPAAHVDNALKLVLALVGKHGGAAKARRENKKKEG
jgi:hypothetical protein